MSNVVGGELIIEPDCDHDWKWIDDWGGDPDVIGGTFDCSCWVCQKCGIEDLQRGYFW